MIGKTLGHSQVTEKLGGGMGVVHKAEDEVLGRHVTIHDLGPELAGRA